MPSKKQRAKAKKSQAPPKQEVVRSYAGWHIGAGEKHDDEGVEIKFNRVFCEQGACDKTSKRIVRIGFADKDTHHQDAVNMAKVPHDR